MATDAAIAEVAPATDAPTTDAAIPDVSVDAPAPLDAPVDVVPTGICGNPTTLDLNVVGGTGDGTLRYQGTLAMMQPRSQQRSCPTVYYPTILRYTVPSAGQYVFSTDHPGTVFSTAMVVLDGCPGAGMSLGCDRSSGVTDGNATIIRPTRSLVAGETIYVVVGSGFEGNPGSRYELTIARVGEAAIGEVCDRMRAVRTCAMGSDCVVPLSAGVPLAEGRCVAHGNVGAACLPSAVCLTGLICANGNVCRATVAIGGDCDPYGNDNACVAGATCPQIDVSSPGRGRCVADGARLGACRNTGERCDEGLACSGVRRCVTAIAVGAACRDSLDQHCVDGANCVAVAGSNVCVMDGALYGRCREGSVCDAGLTCSVFDLCVM